MVDLLKGHKKGGKGSVIINSEEDLRKNQGQFKKVFSANSAQKDKTDLKKYQDPEGLSVGKLNIGLWFIRHRHHFFKAFITVLIIISVVTWSNFLWTFGAYVFVGMRQDNQMLRDLSAYSVHPEIIAAQAPEPLRVGNLQTLENYNGNYDFVVEAENPNPDHYGDFEFYVAVGDEVLGRSEAMLLPEERKYFLILNAEYSGNPNQIQFYLAKQNWRRLNRHKYPDWDDYYQSRLDFSVENKVFTSARESSLSEKLRLNDLQFDFHNQTAYNYWQVNLNMILSSRGKIVAVNAYEVNEIMSGEKRHVQITWPGNIPAVNDITIQPFVDILDDSVFIEFSGEPWDENFE